MIRVVLTGGNQGIGYYLTEQLLQDGNRVAVLDVETDRLEPLGAVYPDALRWFAVDVRDAAGLEQAAKAVMAEFGRVDVVLHNACRCTFGREAETALETYRDVFDVNYFGGLRLAKCFLPYMRRQRSGRVLFTSSAVGTTGFAGIAPYASTKAALEALAKCLALEYAADNITFHVLHPPLTRTRSAAGLPVPPEFMADPETVGRGLARRLMDRRFILCHSAAMRMQMRLCSWFPLQMGRLLDKMTAKYAGAEASRKR